MGKKIEPLELAICLMALVIAAAFFGRALYEATWLPLSDNYHQCGRIFLCPAQR